MMRRRIAWFLLALPLIGIGIIAALTDAPPLAAQQATPNDYAAHGFAFIEKHCVRCHGEKTQRADLALHTFRDEAAVLKGRKVIENVLKQIAAGEMPPKKQPRPVQAEIDAFVKAVNGVFAKNAKLDPGHVTIRRLNRAEYNNTIRDLVGVDFNPAEDFPVDDVGHGFDNIGDVLSLSPVLMERYLAAAESITQRAILIGDPPKPPNRHLAALFLGSTKREPFREVPFRSLEQKGNFHTSHKLTVAGDYKLRVRVWGRQVGDEPVKITFHIDDKEIDSAEVKAKDSKDKQAVIESKAVSLEPGEHRVAVAFVNEFTDPKAEKKEEGTRALFIQYIETIGPMDMVPAAHKRIMTCDTSKPKREQAREILTRFASKAYRRPALPAEVERLLKIVDAAEERKDKFEAGIQLAIQAVLVSPKFLFRVELDDRPDSAEPHAIDEYQLASRLSYFLWSTMPDDELFDLAAKKQLTANLDAQVRRMLKDPKGKALTENFALQWLQLRRLKSFAADTNLFPSFNEQLRSAMQKETELFFAEIVRDNRSILDLIDADFTYLNELLARHYGIADTNGNWMGQKPTKPGGQPIRGPEFARVSLQGGARGGLLTQASILTVTSNPTRTSPVKRGRWVLEQLLGTPPPPPPPNVPELENDKAALTGSLRQRMEQHRANPSCANCHARMDPLGFAFENFNAIGAFRKKDGDFDIDPSGTLPDGQTFQGPAELKTILKAKKDLFARNLTEKMLTYALGRGIEYYDQPTIDRASAALAKDDYRFATLITTIATSDPFRLRRGKDQP
jgi:mono/diheme cytochrome c family protein